MSANDVSPETRRRILHNLKSRAGDANPVGNTAKAVGVSYSVVASIANERRKKNLPLPLTYKVHAPRKDGLRRVVIKGPTGPLMTWWTDRDDKGIEAYVRNLERRLNDDSPGSAFTIN